MMFDKLMFLTELRGFSKFYVDVNNEMHQNFLNI